MKRCMYCGFENDDKAVTCAQCGNRLADTPDGTETRTFKGDDFREQFGRPDEEDSAGADDNGMPELDVKIYERQDDGQSKRDAGAAPHLDLDAALGSLGAGQKPAAGAEVQEAAADAAAQNGAETAGTAADSVSAASGTGVQDGAAAVQDEAGAGQVQAQPEGTFYSYRPGNGGDGSDVGRGSTYAARNQVRVDPQAEAGSRRDRAQRRGSDIPAAQEKRPQVQHAQHGGKTFMVRARKRVKSPLFLLATLFSTLMVGLNFFNIYSGNALYNIMQSDAMLTDLIGPAGSSLPVSIAHEIAGQASSAIGHVSGIFGQLGQTIELGILLVIAVPNVLYCLSLWLMFAQTSTKKRDFAGGGYILARVCMILKFIAAAICLAVGLVISVYFVVVGASGGQYSGSLLRGIILLFAMILLSVVVVMYYLQQIFCLKVVYQNARRGLEPGKMPLYCAILSILIGLAAAALVLPLAVNDYVGIASGVSAALYFVFWGLWIIVYRVRVHH